MKTMLNKKLFGSITLVPLIVSVISGCATGREPERTTTGTQEDKTAEAASAPAADATDQFSTLGAFSWQELTTTDISGAKRFYSTLLGWNTLDAPQEEGSKRPTYTIIKEGDEEIGAIVAMPNPKQGDVAYWAPYVTVEDVDATARRAQQLGGTILIPPTDIPDFGRYSVIQDPQGAEFSIVRYAEGSE